jgi:hypothetical protein
MAERVFNHQPFQQLMLVRLQDLKGQIAVVLVKTG